MFQSTLTCKKCLKELDCFPRFLNEDFALSGEGEDGLELVAPTVVIRSGVSMFDGLGDCGR